MQSLFSNVDIDLNDSLCLEILSPLNLALQLNIIVAFACSRLFILIFLFLSNELMCSFIIKNVMRSHCTSARACYSYFRLQFEKTRALVVHFFHAKCKCSRSEALASLASR